MDFQVSHVAGSILLKALIGLLSQLEGLNWLMSKWHNLQSGVLGECSVLERKLLRLIANGN